ncbi:hypothetical protein I4U23_012164 [Adineta vaga]|nr:hypothetical protein I4U23_012164 [Adineta vaga]
MANWTLKQIIEWLQINGFEKHIQTFIDEDIDGAALMGLRDDDIIKLLAVVDQKGVRTNPTMRTLRKFLAKLEELKILGNKEQKRERRRSGALHSSMMTVKPIGHTVNDSKSHSQIFIVQPRSSQIKFFQSELICNYLQEYLSTNFDVTCNIPMTILSISNTDLLVRLSGHKQEVQAAHQNLQSLFATLHTTILNENNASPKVIKWSKNIHCDLALLVLQKIFIDKKLCTVWEKTSVLSGYYIVHYLTGNHDPSASEEFINHVLNHDISFVKDITVSNAHKRYHSELDEFIQNKKNASQQNQSMAVISLQYPSQKDFKISLFGLKDIVQVTKKQLKLLINKHQMKTTKLNLDSKQREYLLDNCTSHLRNIELNYEDDNVKIQIRESLFTSPQYLVKIIEQLILSMIFQTVNLTFKSIENAFLLTDSDRLQLETLAKNCNCEINHIEVKTEEESIIIPKGNIPATPEHLAKDSNQVSATLFTDQLKTDIIVLSTEDDCIREKIESKNQVGYYQTNTGKNFLYIPWSPTQFKQYDDRPKSILKESIKQFISHSLTQLIQHSDANVKTVAYSTTKWENYPHRQQFIQIFIRQMKLQLESELFANRGWRIILPFHQKQCFLFKMFSDILSKSKTQNNSDEQFSCPISMKIDKPFDLHIWNQFMINDYYNYCLQEMILPNFFQTNSQPQYLELAGPVKKVHIAKEKYELMSQIAHLKRIPANLVPIKDHQSSKVTLKTSKEISNQYNILISYCSLDGTLPLILADHFTDEDYIVLTEASDQTSSSHIASINRADVIVICFSSNYFMNANCRTSLRTAIESSQKTIIPVVLLANSSDQPINWLEWIDVQELYYEIFHEEIKFKLNTNFDLNYERLLIELLQYTKPGVFGHKYPKSSNTSVEESTQNEDAHHHDKTIELTAVEMQTKRRIYEERIQKIVQSQKISEKEMKQLIRSLEVVLKSSSSQESSDTSEEENSIISSEISEQSENNMNERNKQEELNICSEYLHAFFLLIQRWMEEASNKTMIRGNLPPFTLSGDYNDAIFPLPLSNKLPWWDVEDSIQNIYRSKLKELELFPEVKMIGGWFNCDEAHFYFEKLIDPDMQFREERKDIDETTSDEGKNNIISRTYMKFNTSVQRHISVWDRDQDVELLKEYRRRLNNSKTDLPDDLLERWDHYWSTNAQLIRDMVWGKVEAQSRSREECRKLEMLDDPNNELWKKKKRNRGCRKFVKQKIRNTIEWQKFLDVQKDD